MSNVTFAPAGSQWGSIDVTLPYGAFQYQEPSMRIAALADAMNTPQWKTERAKFLKFANKSNYFRRFIARAESPHPHTEKYRELHRRYEEIYKVKYVAASVARKLKT